MAASRNPIARLNHIKDEITALQKALDGVTFESFQDTYMFRRTAEHAILIIPEAVKALSPVLTDCYSSIDWRAIRDIGNVLRHEYYEVDRKVLWLIVTERLPELEEVVDLMIADQMS